MKKVDVAVFDTVKAGPGRLASRAARTPIFDVKSGGVGLGKIYADGLEVRGPGQGGQGADLSGEITDIPTEVK